jgi:4-hydroxybenzoate polyprenyltransferase
VQGGTEWRLSAIAAAVPPHAWWLLLGNLFWVLAYDTEYAMVDRDDDLRIGMKTSAITLGRWDVPAILAFYAAYLLIWAWVLDAPQRSVWLWLALGLAAAQALWHGWLIRHRERQACFLAFRMNHWLGLTVFLGVALSV